MGGTVDAICTCGYSVQNINIGGGMLNFNTFCAFPAICNHCMQIVEVNLLEKTLSCPVCKSRDVISYDNRELMQSKGANLVAEWRVFGEDRHLSLTDGMYLCPSCRKFNLTFQQGNILWD